jgi:GT2 family glycosyltransferase
MKLSIIIVSWNVRELLKKCLASIFIYNRDFDLEVIVIDNASGDDTVKMVSREFPQVNLIINKINLGFAAANNQGIRQATGDYLLLLNPDTEFIDHSFKTAIDFLSRDGQIGLLGCQLLNPNKTVQPSVRRFPSFWPIFLMFFKLPKILPNLSAINKYLAVDFDYRRCQTVEQVMGAFMLLKRGVIEKIGLLDENFFVWFEEVDFCLRVWQAGYQVVYYPDTKVVHHGGQSFKQQQFIKKQWLFFKSALIYFLKHGFLYPKIKK